MRRIVQCKEKLLTLIRQKTYSPAYSCVGCFFFGSSWILYLSERSVALHSGSPLTDMIRFRKNDERRHLRTGNYGILHKYSKLSSIEPKLISNVKWVFLSANELLLYLILYCATVTGLMIKTDRPGVNRHIGTVSLQFSEHLGIIFDTQASLAFCVFFFQTVFDGFALDSHWVHIDDRSHSNSHLWNNSVFNEPNIILVKKVSAKIWKKNLLIGSSFYHRPWSFPEP